MDGEYILKILPSIFEGFLFTIFFFVIVLSISILLSIIIAIFTSYGNRVFNKIINIYTSIIRGTPLLFQMYFVYFGFPIIFNINIDAFNSALLTFIVSWTAYLIEALRGAINSVESGQIDAALILGFTKFQMMRYIVLPQALAIAIPAITNQAVALVYSTAILSILGLNDILKASRIAVIRDLRLEGFLIAGILYILFNSIVIFTFKKIESNLSKYKGKMI